MTRTLIVDDAAQDEAEELLAESSFASTLFTSSKNGVVANTSNTRRTASSVKRSLFVIATGE